MYDKSVLHNGISVVTEKVPSRTVSTGIWLNVGSRDESVVESGCAHFCEHMMFKGTPSRNARDIARELDRLGGTANAFTSKEVTCLHGSVLDEHLPDFLDILSDLFLHSSYDSNEIGRELQVILQEIGMVEDTPEELIHDLFAKVIWGDSPLGNAVLGDPEQIAVMSRLRLLNFTKVNYTPKNILIAAAGSVEHDKFVQSLETRFADNSLSLDSSARQDLEPIFQAGRLEICQKELEQVHVVLGGQGLAANSADRYALILLNIILGGNMSSRLFQEVREKRGLAYSIYSFADFNRDVGTIGICAAIGSENINQFMDVVKMIIDDLINNGISAAELDRARDAARTSMYLAAEGMEARMHRLARNEMLFARHISLDESDQSLAAVGLDDVHDIARLLGEPLSGVVLGPVKELDLPWSDISLINK